MKQLELGQEPVIVEVHSQAELAAALGALDREITRVVMHLPGERKMVFNFDYTEKSREWIAERAAELSKRVRKSPKEAWV